MTAGVQRVVAAIVVVALTLGGAPACRNRADRVRGGTPASGTTTTVASDASAAAACPSGDVESWPAGRSRQTLASGGVERSYLLYVPPSVSTAKALPLVVNMHGFGSNGEQQLALTGVETLAERESFVVAAPNGAGSPPRFDLFGAGDVTFIAEMIDAISSRTCIDRARVFAMGMSNGGAMSSVLACRSAERFAAVAPVAAIVYSESQCGSSPPTPIVAFMGDADTVVPYQGGRVNCCGNPTITAAPTTMAGWARHNGCDETPLAERIADDVRVDRWRDCDRGADTVFYTVEGGGHTWPGGAAVGRLGRTTRSIDATAAIWSFFANHPREAAGAAD